MMEQGREIFRYDTFGDEAFWGDTLRLHEAVAGAALGGVGDGVSPTTALAVGLKVDAAALPQELATQIQQGQVDLDDPATTLALLGGIIGVVVGVAVPALIKLAFAALPAETPFWSILVGLIVSMSVGIFFGLYPAVKASRLDPIEALRYE